MPSGYAPLYYASAVLADGRVVTIGGEYNVTGNSAADTNLGAIYDPVKDTWTSLSGPKGWNNIGDASSCVLPSGKLLLANQFGSNGAILDPSNLTWSTASFTNKADNNSEEGWTLLPDGTILTVDCQNGTQSELYNPTKDTWSGAGSTGVTLPAGINDIVPEMGPQVLRPDGTVICFGASGHNAVYDSNKKTWGSAPDFPLDSNGNQLDIADGPACLLPSGNVLCVASPGIFNLGVQFFEFDGTNLISEPEINYLSTEISSYQCNMLMLPTGQVLFTDTADEVEIYTPAGSPNSAWAPTISNCPSAVVPGQTYTISGTQFNGLSQASAYGDDSQNATNYPLVRITNHKTQHVIYFRTHDHSTMAVATGSSTVSTKFDVPSSVELGDADLVVVANGIASSPVTITVANPPTATATTVSVAHDTATAITLSGTDPNSPARTPLTYAIATNPSHGALSNFNPATGAVTYTPNTGYSGADSFTFTVTNSVGLTSASATATLKVAIGTPTANPQSVSTNQETALGITLTGADDDSPALTLTYSIATNPSHGKLSGFNASTGAVTYTPNAGYYGSDSFTFTVNNGTNTSAAGAVSVSVIQTLFDVSNQISITRNVFQIQRSTGAYLQVLTLTNTGNTTINGPISVILNSLTNATLNNATGTTSSLLPSGRPYINASVTSLAPGASTKITLSFNKTGSGSITYSTQVVAGPGSR